MVLAVEIWRGVYEEFGLEVVLGAMKNAEQRREFWLESRVDDVLKESWRKFVEESWLGSRGEFLEVGIAYARVGMKRFVEEMAHAHRDEDIGSAIELWRGLNEEGPTTTERLRHWGGHECSAWIDREHVWSEGFGRVTPRILELAIELAENRRGIVVGLEGGCLAQKELD